MKNTNDNMKVSLETKRNQAKTENEKEAFLKPIRSNLVKFYQDQMQNQTEDKLFILSNDLERFHAESCGVALKSLENQVSISQFQEILQEELKGMYTKYIIQNDMKLNFAKDVAPAIGIDLGTKYSRVAVYYGGKVITPYDIKTLGTASYWMYLPKDTKYVGNAAKNHDMKASRRQVRIYDVKRIIGRETSDPELQLSKKKWRFKIVDDNGIPKINRSRRLSPERLCAELISHLRALAAKHIGLKPEQITKAVITVPAYFNDRQRQATKKAGELAGLEVLAISNEPEAAAMAYSLKQTDNKARKMLLFDLGGGTLDVTLLNVSPGNTEILDFVGNPNMSGEIFDLEIMEYCLTRCFQTKGREVQNDKGYAYPYTRQFESYSPEYVIERLRTDCENAKKVLSLEKVTTVITGDGNIFIDADIPVEITKNIFEKLNTPHFEKMIEIVTDLLQRSHLTNEYIDDVVLVGGSTHIPKIHEMLTTYFGASLIRNNIDPETVVVYGAAIMAAKLNGEQVKGRDDFSFDTISYVTHKSLGIAVEHETLLVVIPKNTKLPIRKTVQYNIPKDYSSNFTLFVYQGEKPLAKDNELVGELQMDSILRGKKEEEHLDVTMEVDFLGALHVEAENGGNKTASKIDLFGGTRMSTGTKRRLSSELTRPFKKTQESNGN